MYVLLKDGEIYKVMETDPTEEERLKIADRYKEYIKMEVVNL